MAIDTAEKRKSLSGIQHFLIAGVTPTAAKDQEWRQESGWGYPGILAATPSATLQALKSLTLELGGGLGMTLLPTGNSLPISIVTAAPSGAPPGNKGVVFRVSGGAITIYVWDGSAWRSLT